MTEADKIFERFPDFIREYIYSHSWDSLRAVQIAAARSIFYTENNLLLTSSTASGKTEAAFFPILTLMHEDMPSSVGVLYIAPLKSLINDQFERITAYPLARRRSRISQKQTARKAFGDTSDYS